MYDAAVLVAADRNERRSWAEHRVRLELGVVPLVPAPVVAQVSQSPQQAQLRRFLAGCTVVPLDEKDAHAAGGLLAKTRTADGVDAVLVPVALRNKAVILTGDPDDIERLVQASGRCHQGLTIRRWVQVRGSLSEPQVRWETLADFRQPPLDALSRCLKPRRQHEQFA